MSNNYSQHQSTTALAVFQALPFDAIRLFDEQGNEYWSARDLQELIGTLTWERSEVALERASIACNNSGEEPSGHFVNAAKPIISGKGREQDIKDYHLTRYACYLTALNGDPRKPEISAAQTYFVMRTREAEQKQLTLQRSTFIRALCDPQELRQAIVSHEGKIQGLKGDVQILEKEATLLQMNEEFLYPEQATPRKMSSDPIEQAIYEYLSTKKVQLMASQLRSCYTIKDMPTVYIARICMHMVKNGLLQKIDPIHPQTACRFFV